MSDSSILKSPWGELTMDPEVANRFDRLDDTHGKMFDLLRDQAEKFNQHRVESTQSRTEFDARISTLEGSIERRSALRSGTIMAGIGALAGAVAAAIGKKTGLWGVALCVILTGCGTPESVRQSNAFNIEAGSDIVQVASELNALAETLTISSPPVAASLKAIAAHLKAVGENIREGSKQIERKLGAPENPQVYSVEKHAQTNAEAKKDIDDQEAVKKGITGWIEGAVKKVGDTLWPGLGGMAIGAFFWLRKNLQFNELKRGASVVIDTVNKLPPDMAKTVKGAVETAASKVGAGELVKGMVKKLES